MTTDQQVRRLRVLIHTEKTQAMAAAKAGMDEKTARKYLKSQKLPSQSKKDHRWRTREDPFEGQWDQIKEFLAVTPGLEAKTIFEQLQRRKPGQFADGQLRTLLADRYERGSVMISSNLPFSKWERIFKDPMVTAVAIDRLVHHSVILELNIPSYRMATAQGKKIMKTAANQRRAQL